MGASSAGLSAGRVRASVSPAKCDAFQGPLCDAFPRRTLCPSPASHQLTQGKRPAAVQGAERAGAALGWFSEGVFSLCCPCRPGRAGTGSAWKSQLQPPSLRSTSRGVKITPCAGVARGCASGLLCLPRTRQKTCFWRTRLIVQLLKVDGFYIQI